MSKRELLASSESDFDQGLDTEFYQEGCSPIIAFIEHDEKLISTLTELRTKIENLHDKTRAPKTVGTTINCLAAGASVGSILGGLALAPVTAGMSLGLAVGGLAGVLVGTGVNLTTDAIKEKRMKEYLNELNQLGEDHDSKLRQLFEQLKSSQDNNAHKIIEILIKDHGVDSQCAKVLSTRGMLADAVTVSSKVGAVLDAKEAAKLAEALGHSAPPAPASASISAAAATSGSIAVARLATGIAITGAVASVGFAVWDVASLIKRWGDNPTADKVEKLRMEIEKEMNWLKSFFKV